MSFSSNLRRLRKSHNLTMEELANNINKAFEGAKFNKSMISKYENGKEATNINANYLASYFGVSLNELLGMDPSLEVGESPAIYTVNNQIPIIGTISAGTPIFADQNVLGYAPAPPLMSLEGRNVFYLKIKGESMNKEFDNGSFVLIDRDLPVENGEIAAVLVNGYDATVKKIHLKDNLLTLIPMSNDDSYLPEIINLENEEVTIIGKVIGAFKNY